MEILDKSLFQSRLFEMLEEMKSGKIFVYPTDTIYGIGCNATNSAAVEQIRNIKKRETRPFSIIVPSKAWITNNCIVNEGAGRWLSKLPGPYTLIMKARPTAVPSNVTGGLDTVGIRIPKHWFSDAVAKAGIPFVTTSVNVSGEPHMTSIDDMDLEMMHSVDYIINEGTIKNKPSRVIDLLDGTVIRD
jgi:L-threonylcarbamoyladenylate synthase